jgi:hypothetical protein
MDMKYSSRIGATVSAVAIAALIIAAVPASVQAQSPKIKVHVPFEFHVGDMTLPSGTYTVRTTGINSAISVSDNKGHTVMVLTNPVPNPNPRSEASGQLSFNVYEGNQYFLREVRWGGYSTARGLEKSRMELRMVQTSSKATNESIAAK